MPFKNKTFLFLFAALLLFATPLAADDTKTGSQDSRIDELRSVAPNVYLDCSRRSCDINYIRTEITFVNYVSDRKDADVHILVTQQTTGSGGREYTIAFIGLRDHLNSNSTLTYFSKSTDTPDLIRKGMVNVLKQGLIPYVSDTPLAEFISISYDRKTSGQKTQIRDPWNFWVFNVGLRGNLNMEDLYRRLNYSVSLSANRTTENMKFLLWANGNYDRRKYDIPDEETYISNSNRKTLFSQYVKSINSHWSAGLSTSLYASTYDNADFYITIGPAVEFNIFPYEESTRRQLRIQYRLNYSYRNYIETTIFFKDRETLFSQALEAILAIREPWGNAGLQVEWSNFFHDFSKNNFKVEGGISIRMLKGLSFNVNAEYSRVRDQLSLPGGGATKDEILLELKRLATGYELRLEAGLNFRFGSIYSNIVNPRFGNR